ncbi:leucine-rich repeat protein [uncultured Eubacterium sp.]|uniref:leucine-rich repeat protein n=1 Tax=uncultured Eubacterium sp. TaxID=165185 RepID=UPI002593D30E|nr:leucine-rich repeat protein [uncultured Eubacterium sp.]
MMENENYLQQSEGMHLGETSDISLSASADNDTHQAVVEMNNDPEVVVIAEGTTEIAPNEYKERVNLKEVRLPKSLEKIGKRAFYGCQNLTVVVFGGNEKVIEDEAFANCRALRKIELPDSLEEIGYGAIENFELGGTIALTNLKKLGARNFNISSSLKFEVGPNLEDIGMSSFNCVTKINVSSDNKKFKLRDGLLLDRLGTRLLFCERDMTDMVLVPATVTKIDDYAFYNCRKIKGVTIPDAVTEIPGYAFSGCEALTEVYLPGKLEKIARFAFYRCKALTEINIPGTVKKIESYAFGSCQGLKEVKVSDVCETRGAFESTVVVVPVPADQLTFSSHSSAATSRSSGSAAVRSSSTPFRTESAAAYKASVSSYSSALGSNNNLANQKRDEINDRRMEQKRQEQMRVKEERQNAQEELNARMREEFMEKKDALMQKVAFIKDELRRTSGVNVLKKNKLNNQLYECTIQAIDLNGKYGTYIDESEKIEIDD